MLASHSLDIVIMPDKRDDFRWWRWSPFRESKVYGLHPELRPHWNECVFMTHGVYLKEVIEVSFINLNSNARSSNRKEESSLNCVRNLSWINVMWPDLSDNFNCIRVSFVLINLLAVSIWFDASIGQNYKSISYTDSDFPWSLVEILRHG